MEDDKRPEPTLDADTVDESNEPRGVGTALQPGARVGEYTIQEGIAAGGFGAVYRAVHDVLGRPVALKVLHAEVASSPEVLARFEREARAVNLIRHPNVVDVHDFGRLDDGRPYFVMELLSGIDLEAHLERHGRLSAGETLRILEPLCEALAIAHDNGIIHRDLKASNIFLAEQDGKRRVVLLDFGIAKLTSATDPGLTTARHAVGTPTCMAPEQITGGVIDVRTDVYGLGVLVYRMVTGSLPFGDESSVMMQYMHLHAAAPRPGDRTPRARPFDELVRSAMAKDPERRFQTVAELLAALKTAVDRASRAATNAAGPRQALGAYIEVLVDERDFDNPDSILVDDIAAVIPAVADALESRGFIAALESGTSMLMVLPLPDGLDEATARRDSVDALLAVATLLDERPTRDARVHVNICLHVGRAVLAGSRALGGELLRLGWIARGRVSGVTGTARALEGIGATTERVPGNSELLRVVT